MAESRAAKTELARMLARPDIRTLAAAIDANPGAIAEAEEPVRRAAVAAILREGTTGALELFFIKRAEFAGDPWSGHVALPGGRREPQDESLLDTAIRETLEETAIDLRRDGVVLGALDELYPRSPTLPRIVVRPYVMLVRPDVRIVPSGEVASVFWSPVHSLRSEESRAEHSIATAGGTMRTAAYRSGPHVIWGLTHRIMVQLFERMGG